ncbi:hypothetical protein AL755_08435 [Arthrobacter sp. ERGS1:01]|uniref:hypothetical protein n=1 Tax=Arthrobacter sp. ERGS1:01 TaxID=1704044 RepID=UPI0006B56DE3|nr:hypothetical protein [Arthrobacter sp. ERGS1:01]ALE05499.1 hypothetical protein AL755_08435 [Arthrobacter sp. ERGS1:01]
MASERDLVKLRQKRAAAEDAFEKADAAFRDGIRAALADGMKAAQIADATGLSRPRIYQIRDGRR